MDNAVMLSIRHEWCELIASGKKTVEVRKSRPKLETPFRCYIYQTLLPVVFVDDDKVSPSGKVIGEFVCDRIFQYSAANIEGQDISAEEMQRQSCLTLAELDAYEHSAEPKENCIYLVGLYGWHISDLVIYDKLKELSEFISGNSHLGYKDDGRSIGWSGMKRPPQSWCYVEEVHP